MSSSVLLPVLIVFLVLFFLWNWRSTRKRRQAEQEKTSQLAKGVDVMTNFGLFGTVESIDLENNKVVLQTSPGHFVTVHRQTIARIETPADATDATSPVDSAGASSASSPNSTTSAIAEANAAAQAQAAGASDQPKFGERKSDD